MKKIKIFILFFFIFLLCGCSVKYNLYIDDNSIKEDFMIYSSISEAYSQKYSNVTLKEYYEIRSQIPQPSLINQNIPNSEEYEPVVERVEGIEYYNNKYIFNSSSIGINFDYTYKDNFKNGFLVNNYLDNFNFSSNANGLSIVSYVSKPFLSYELLDNIEVNIITNRNVINNNADKVNDNTYTWTIDRSNYTNKTILLTIKDIKEENNINDNITPVENQKNNKKIIIIIILSIVILGCLIYLFIKKKNKLNNKI